MMYRYHPEIDGLKINEDGSRVLYRNERLKVSKLNKKERDSDMLYVIFMRRTFSLGRLICECWHGMPDNPRLCATRIDKSKGYHYTNLMWAKCGSNLNPPNAKRDPKSKIKEEDIPVIEERIKAGETLRSIAADYKTSDMSISRIKKRMQK